MADPYDTYNPYKTQTSLLESSLEALQQQKREAQERQLKSTEFSLPLEKSVAGGIASALTMGLGYALGGYKGAGIGAESSKNIVPTLYGLEENKAKNAAAQAGLEVEAADQAISTTREQLGRYQLEGLKADRDAAINSPGGYKYDLEMQKLAARNQGEPKVGANAVFTPENFKIYEQTGRFPAELPQDKTGAFISAANAEKTRGMSPYEAYGAVPRNPEVIKAAKERSDPAKYFPTFFNVQDTTNRLLDSIKKHGLQTQGTVGALQGAAFASLSSAIKNLREYGGALTPGEDIKVTGEIGLTDFFANPTSETLRTLIGRRGDPATVLESFKDALAKEARAKASYWTYNFDEIANGYASAMGGPSKEPSLEDRLNKEMAELQQLKAMRQQLVNGGAK